MARERKDQRYMDESEPEFRRAWAPHEKSDVDYGLEPRALKYPELLTGASFDTLKNEKKYVESSEKVDTRLETLMQYIAANEPGDGLVHYIGELYPHKKTRCRK